jgi:hypothetical protein
MSILLERVLFECHIPLQAELHVPKCSESIFPGFVYVSVAFLIFAEPPELDEWRHKLVFVTLRTDEGKANNKLLVEQVLHHQTSIYECQVEVYGQPFDHIKPLLVDVVVKSCFELLLRDKLDAAVVDEWLEDPIEVFLGFVPYNLLPENFKKKYELVDPCHKVDWRHQDGI